MTQKNKITVAVAMSGGVDSSAVAYLLKEEGYNVFGITLDLLQPPYNSETSAVKDAKEIADKIGIPHYSIDLKKDFFQHVIKYFTSNYLGGLTPSPCIICNKEIKLGLLAKKSFDLGADYIYTGHYAKIIETPHGTELHRADNLAKDQSYFLFAIEKETLNKLRCPLASFSKEKTREVAKKIGLTVHEKNDSQDICFVNNGKYVELIKKLKPNYEIKSGRIINEQGDILGEHKGIINYTIGQRRGLGVSSHEILYVTKIDALNNTITVGPKEELAQTEVIIGCVNWLGEEKPDKLDIMVKLRSRQEIVPATIHFLDNDTAKVILKSPFYGVAAGQGCCFYEGSRVLGGGFILK